MSATFKKMGRWGNRFTNGLCLGLRRVEKKGLRVRGVMGGILGAAGIQKGLGVLRAGVSGVVTEFLDFDDAITAAAGKFGIFDRKGDAFKDLGKTARAVGATTEYKAAQAAEGLRFLAKAGWDANAAMTALPSFVDLATASELEFSRAADIATDTMGAFGLQSDNKVKNLKNLQYVNDTMSKAVNSANIDMEDLFETIKMAGPVARTAGVSLTDFAAVAAFVGGAGLKGTLGGTAMRTMMLNMVAPTGKIAKKLAEFNTEIKDVKKLKQNREDLKKLGIELDGMGKLNFIKTLEKLNDKLKELGPAQRAAALEVIFGKRAIAGAAVSISGASGALQKFQKGIKDSKGDAKKLAEFMRTSLNKRLETLKSSAIEVGLKLFDAFGKDLPGSIDKITDAIKKIDMQQVVRDIKHFGTVAKKAAPLVLGLATAFTAVGTALMIKEGVGAFSLLLASPVGMFIVALGSVAAAIYTIATNWDDLKLAVKWTIDEMKNKIGELADHPFFKYNLFTALPSLIIRKWGPIGTFFKKLGEGIVSGMEWTGAKLTAFLRGIGKFFKKLFADPGRTIGELLQGIQNAVRKAAGWVMGLSKSIKNALGFGDAGSDKSTPSLSRPSDSTIVPPNKTTTEAQKQSIEFNGKLDVFGAPEGSKIESTTTGAPQVRMSLMGAN
jgi:TP901 family phage tail tape measure protein